MASSYVCLLASLTFAIVAAPARGAEDLENQVEQAVRQAVQRVAPSVVQIQTIGGLDRVGQGQAAMLIGTGPTTGLVVSPDGYIISSAFNFIQKPASILVGLPDGSRAPAKLIATDHSRQLTLLKVDVESLKVERLVVPTVSPDTGIRVGQWAIALGRTFEGPEPNVSVGIVSATRRIWGKAIQTDAKISPGNYGGPLVDIQGRVMGVLVPLSPQSTSDVAGVEWYDSGIGFAVSLEQINKVLPELKLGKDLHAGIMGINFQGNDQLSAEPVIAAVRAGSPAADAGLKAGDKVIELEGTPVVRQAQIRQVIGPRYAGEVVTIAVLRDKERHEHKLTLVAKLEPYQHPFLGILPLRTPRSEAAGVAVRYVYPGSPADKAGIKPGDVISSIGSTPIKRRDDMLETMNSLKPGQKVAVTFRRADAEQKAEALLATLPETVPDKLPAAREAGNPPQGERPPVGVLREKQIAGHQNFYLAYVPENYDSNVPHGILVWLHEPGGYKEDELLAKWKPVCDAQDLILLAPKSVDATKWLPTEVEFLKKMLDETVANYNVDRSRVVTHGFQAGGAMALILGFQQRDLVRGIASVDGALSSQPAENEPTHRQAFYLTNAAKALRTAQIKAGIEKLKQLKFPVTVRDQGDTPHPLTGDDLAEFARWLDTLDRL